MGINIYTHPLPPHSLQQTDLTLFSANKNDVYVCRIWYVYVACGINEVCACNVCLCDECNVYAVCNVSGLCLWRV